MLMCMCVNLILRASRWYSDSNSTCSLNSFIIKSIWMFSEHHNSLFNVHWTSSQMLVQMFNEHLIQHQWRYTTNCQKIVLRAGSERGFSALSQNVFAYVWERSLNLLMLRNLYIEIIMRTFEKCHCTVTHSSDRLYQQNLRMILSALQSMWLLMQRLKSWQQRLRLWTLRTVNKIECIERLFTRKVLSHSQLSSRMKKAAAVQDWTEHELDRLLSNSLQSGSSSDVWVRSTHNQSVSVNSSLKFWRSSSHSWPDCALRTMIE
jgi:hypothetical protein